jgi:hypothetical protein
MTSDLALAVEGLRIHEHEESFPSEGEDEDEDISVPPSEDSSFEEEVNEEFGESSDEETILAPRTLASLPQPLSDEALRARYPSPRIPSNVQSLHTFEIKGRYISIHRRISISTTNDSSSTHRNRIPLPCQPRRFRHPYKSNHIPRILP